MSIYIYQYDEYNESTYESIFVEINVYLYWMRNTEVALSTILKIC